MAYVIVDTCIDCKDASCVACCPVDCIYEGPRTFYIHPDECIDCGICVSVCPPEAIWEDVEVPKHLTHFIAIQSALDAEEAAVAREVAAQLSPQELRGWFAELKRKVPR